MRKRDENKNRKEIFHAVSMIMQIGLSVMVCMSVCALIGYGLDSLFGTRWWMVVMLFVGIFSSLRSMLVLTGAYHPGAKKEKDTKESTDEGSSD